MNSETLDQNQPDQNGNSQSNRIREIHHHHYHERRGLNFGQLFIGLLLLFFGIAFLARSLGLIEFNFLLSWNIVWPVLLILIALSLITFRGWLGGIIGIILVFILAGIVIWLAFLPLNFRSIGNNGFFISNNQTGSGDQSILNETTNGSEQIAIPVAAGAARGDINVNMNGGKIDISGGSQDLVSGDFSSSWLKLEETSALQGNTQSVNINTALTAPMTGGGNTLALKLNSGLPIKLNVSSGATEMNFDLSSVSAGELNIDTGASSLVLKMGDKVETANVLIKAGASSIKIVLPFYLGAKIKLDSGLSKTNFQNFKKIDDHNYVSKNYDAASKKVNFDLSVGASGVDIGWE